METQQYPYDEGLNYSYDAGKIEVSDGVARLKDLGGGVYAADEPVIQPAAALAPFGISSWSGFTEALGAGNQGEVAYQLSDDGGSSWYYWDGSIWAAAGGHNPAAVIEANISAFKAGPSGILFRAFLISDGTQAVELDLSEIIYRLMPDFPALTPDYDYEESLAYEGIRITRYPNGMEQRLSTVSTPRHRFGLKFGLLSTADMDLLWEFYIQQGGPLRPFIFTSPRSGQRYIARFVNKVMSRTLFAYLLESTGLTLIEVVGEG